MGDAQIVVVSGGTETLRQSITNIITLTLTQWDLVISNKPISVYRVGMTAPALPIDKYLWSRFAINLDRADVYFCIFAPYRDTKVKIYTPDNSVDDDFVINKWQLYITPVYTNNNHKSFLCILKPYTLSVSFVKSQDIL